MIGQHTGLEVGKNKLWLLVGTALQIKIRHVLFAISKLPTLNISILKQIVKKLKMLLKF